MKFAVRKRHAFHGSRRGAHTGVNDATLQSGTRGAGPTEQKAAVSDGELTVCSHIEEQGDFFFLINAGGKEAADDISAEIIGLAWHTVHIAGDWKIQIRSAEKSRRIGADGIGGLEDTEGVEANEKMNHCHIAGYHHREIF